MSKVLLIVPTHGYKVEYPKFLSITDFPMGFPYLASSLEVAGHTVYGLNLNNIVGYASAYDMIRDLIPDAIKQVNPDLIGLGGLCIDYAFLKDAIKLIRDNCKIPIVLGGGIVSNDAEFIFKTLKPDYAIIGEGEESIVKLANGEPLESIPNLWYWEDRDVDSRKDELQLDSSRKELIRMGFTESDIGRMIEERVYEIAEYTGEPIKEVADKMNSSVKGGEGLWNEMNPKTEGDLLKFHSLTQRKIYSATALSDYLAVIREKFIRRILERKIPASILDFGGSHGHISIAVAQAGFDVTYADIGLEIRKFVKWKAKKRNLKINFAPVRNSKCVFTDKKYDYIVCLDVASHLPNIKRYMRDFHDCLKDNGELLFGDDLYDFNVPWHLKENEVYKDPEKKKELFKDFKFIEHLWANCDIWGKA